MIWKILIKYNCNRNCLNLLRKLKIGEGDSVPIPRRQKELVVSNSLFQRSTNKYYYKEYKIVDEDEVHTKNNDIDKHKSIEISHLKV